MQRKPLKSDLDALLPYLSTTPADAIDLMDDLSWSHERLEDAFCAIRRLGIRLDTREDRVRVLASSWPVCERLALEAFED